MNARNPWITYVLVLTMLPACRGPEKAPNRAVPTAPETTPTAPQSTSEGVVNAIHAAVGLPVTVSCPPNDRYPADGVESLVDGRMGTASYYDAEWMGWWYMDKPFEATIDLGRLVAIEELGVHTLTSTESWIFYPRSVEYALSQDGETFKVVARIAPTEKELETTYEATQMLKASNLGERARYVRVCVERYGSLPSWHLGYGGADGYEGEAWLFIDEILVNPR